MKNSSESEERRHLEDIRKKIARQIDTITGQLQRQSSDIQESKRYLHENKAGMDHVEKVNVRQSIEQSAMVGEAGLAARARLRKLLNSPYFGRIDFISFPENTQAEPDPGTALYIGIYGYYDDLEKQNLIYDWRAPISAMYYDFEPGPAHYQSQNGLISGHIERKRQYRIRSGVMEYMLENSLNIHDDVLQRELSRSSDEKMKNIVATIQSDQNAIIRNEEAPVLIIQGVAGSGKTSIALHRIAYLLYRFKESLRSNEVLILSPNKVYADYISNVLPELGEESIPELGMEELASAALDNKYPFQSFFEQVEWLLEKHPKDFADRIAYKARQAFLEELDRYIFHLESEGFKPEDLRIKRCIIPAWYIQERFEARRRLPIMQRFGGMLEDMVENVRIHYKYEFSTEDKNMARKMLRSMFSEWNLLKLYKGFYRWKGREELFKMHSRSALEYADVFPLIYLKLRLEGLNSYDQVRHLLIDEMQDYTPVQYIVLSRLFPCRKTILGDLQQSVNPYSSSSAESIQQVFSQAQCVRLYKSYRSTFEITQFSLGVLPNPEVQPVERRGEEPRIQLYRTAEEEFQAIRAHIDAFQQSDYQSFGIVLKTQKDTQILYDKLNSEFNNIHIFTSQSAFFSRGIVLVSAAMAKGLEFDQVLIPQVNEKNYHSDMDRLLLYIACTRAMHQLLISASGKISPMLHFATT